LQQGCCINNRIKRSLISHARRLSLSWEPRTRAKAQCKVAPALHRCSKCGVLCYEGKSDKNYEAYVEQFSDEVVLFEGIKMDHIQPCIDPVDGFTGWDDFYKGLFCEEINYRGLCSPCHDVKSSQENQIRGKKNVYFNPKKKK
jgi:hypothetical protein